MNALSSAGEAVRSLPVAAGIARIVDQIGRGPALSLSREIPGRAWPSSGLARRCPGRPSRHRLQRPPAGPPSRPAGSRTVVARLRHRARSCRFRSRRARSRRDRWPGLRLRGRRSRLRRDRRTPWTTPSPLGAGGVLLVVPRADAERCRCLLPRRRAHTAPSDASPRCACSAPARRCARQPRRRRLRATPGAHRLAGIKVDLRLGEQAQLIGPIELMRRIRLTDLGERVARASHIVARQPQDVRPPHRVGGGVAIVVIPAPPAIGGVRAGASSTSSPM